MDSASERTSAPKISVILPTFNRAQFLPVALRSVLEQTYPDIEVIVVDDGSTDNTREVVAAFSDARIHYTYEENKGISGAMNTGLKAARGKYIGRIDSDDRWLPELLSEEAAVLDSKPEIGLVYSRAQAMDSEGRPMAQILGAPEKFPGETFKSILYGDFLCAITSLIRKECLDQVGGYDEDLRGNEDWDIGIRLAAITHFYLIPRVLANFRFHPGRFTSGESKNFHTVAEGRLIPLDKAFSQPDLPPEVARIKPIAYQNAHMDIALRWLSVRNTRKTLGHFWQALRLGGHPLATLGRMLYLLIFYRYLSKRSWGVRLVERLVKLRRNKIDG